MLLNKIKIVPPKYGQLSKSDIVKEIQRETGMRILSCIDISQNVHASSIDITPTIVCMSVKSGMLQTVYVKKTQCINSYYVYVKPHDTILIISNECISLPNYISGYVTSRVSNVVNGFGHICTTIDPNWNGALLIGLSNPTNRTIKIDVGTSTRCYNNDETEFVFDKKPLATLTFHYLSTPVSENITRHSSMRVDLLTEICYKNRTGLKTFMRSLFYPKQKNYTDYFFEYLNFNENEMQTEDGWIKFLKEFSVFNTSQKSSKHNSTYYKSASNFIVKENLFNRGRHFFENHKTLLTIIFFVVLLLTFSSSLTEEDLISILIKMLKIL